MLEIFEKREETHLLTWAPYLLLRIPLVSTHGPAVTFT
jgi:hypothetical protein